MTHRRIKELASVIENLERECQRLESLRDEEQQEYELLSADPSDYTYQLADNIDNLDEAYDDLCSLIDDLSNILDENLA